MKKKNTALTQDVRFVKESIDNLKILYGNISEEDAIVRSTSSLCGTCRKSKICNPHNNYKVQAIECSKYIARKLYPERRGTMLIQQGDVLIKSVKQIKGKKLNHLTLAKGEATGHHHTITEGDAELYEDNGVLYLRVFSKKATLTHQEHHAVEIPCGDYEIGIVQEYDHFAEEARHVQD